MRIVFVITGLAAGGAENMLLRLLERIDRMEFSCFVFSLTDIGDMGPKIKALGVPVEALGMRSVWTSLKGFFRLVQRMNQIKPDLVHTWMHHADLLGGLAAKMAKVPAVVWCVRSADFLPFSSKWSTRVIMSFCRMVSPWVPSIVVYNSQKGLDYHAKLKYREPNRVLIPNGIDTGYFKPDERARFDVRRELCIPATTPLIGLIGRYDFLKNHAGFIQAAIQLHKVMPQVHYVLVGKDVDESNQALNSMIARGSLSECCHLLGLRQDIPRITAALDLATLASWSEAFPNVLIEAMACGIPCVSTNAGDAALILEEDGWIVSVGDMKELANQWAKFFCLDAEERRSYAERVRRRALAKFDIAVVARRYEEMYRYVIKGDTEEK